MESAPNALPATAQPDLSRKTTLSRYEGEVGQAVFDLVPVEEPLQIRMAGEDVVVTMRTPGHDYELAAGFLYTEGIIGAREQIADMRYCLDEGDEGEEACEPSARNVLNVTPTDRSLVDPRRWRRNLYASSSCGLCGKVSIEQVMLGLPQSQQSPPRLGVVSLATLYSLPQKMRQAQHGFEQTGGLHAATLFTRQGDLLALREDVGRHNAVDKALGYALLNGLFPLHEIVLAVSSRASFEIVQKAIAAGVGVMATVSAPTSLAVELARAGGLTLVAFLREGRCNVYSGEERIG